MSKQERHLYEFGPYRLFPQERQLLRAGEPVQLTPKAFETLVALVRRAGHLADKGELLKEVWPDSFVEESNLAQNVFALRRALGAGENGKPYIETVPKRGYRFMATVRAVEERPDEVVVRQHVQVETAREGPQKNGVTSATPLGAPGDLAREPEAVGDQSEAVLLRELASTRPGGDTALARPEPEGATASGLVEAAGTRSVRRRRLKAGWVAVSGAAAALLLVGLGVVLTRLFLNSGPPPNAIQLSRLISGMNTWSAALSPDGRYVAHVVENAGQTSIWVRQVSTTTDLPIVPADGGAHHWGLTFSRDGDYLYYVKYRPGETYAVLYRVPTLGGTQRKIVVGIDSQITTSPDGKQIAFVRQAPGESHLMIADTDGTNERRLAVRQKPTEFFSGHPPGGPSWSPDGRSIATGVISLKGGYHGEVVLISVSDGTERPLTPYRWFQVAQVAWLSDGSGLLVTARASTAMETSTAQIWHVSYPNGAVRQVTSDLSNYFGVSLTADSRTLVTVQYNRPSTITFMPEKPAFPSKRSTAAMNEGFYGMSWAPDGRLAYASEASGNLDVWLMGADGVTTEQLTNDAGHDSTPSVSPDGRSLVFVSSRGGDIRHIWRMDIDGSNQRQLTNQAFENTPSFTPDGRWVVYTASGSGIWKVPAEGGQPVLIYEGSVHTPIVSPDGTLIACSYRHEKGNEAAKIALLPIEGGVPVKFLEEPEGLSGPAVGWTQDGRALIYLATRDGVSNLWTLPLDGGAPRTLTEFTSGLIFNFAWSRDHAQLALARGSISRDVVMIKDFR